MTIARTIHFLDVEYLGCGPLVTAADIERVLARYRRLVGLGPADLAIGAASRWVYPRIAFDCPSCVRLLLAGTGPDAADHRLLDEARIADLTRFDRVVVASGDHIFAALVDLAHCAGTPAWVAAYDFNAAATLRDAADEFVNLGGFAMAE